jgi:hypothetical protein
VPATNPGSSAYVANPTIFEVAEVQSDGLPLTVADHSLFVHSDHFPFDPMDCPFG